jgi:signal transduction histidine kinase
MPVGTIRATGDSPGVSGRRVRCHAMSDALITQLGLTIVYLAVAGLMAVVRRGEGTRAITLWMLAFLLLAADAGLSAVVMLWGLPEAIRGVAWMLLLGGLLTGLVGTFTFVGRRPSKWVYILGGSLVVTVSAGLLLGVDLDALRVVAFEGMSVVLVWVGLVALQAGPRQGAGRWVGCSAFFGAAVYAALWPLLQRSGWAARLEFFLDTTVLLWGVIGVLHMHFDATRERVLRLNAQKLALREQLARAERAEALGRLAVGVAHDFNNVLSVAIAGSEAALRELGDRPQAAAQLRLVLDAAQGAAGFTRQLLALGRQKPPVRTPMRFKAALENALRIVRPSLPVEVAVAVADEAGDPEVYAAEGQLEQLIVNLLMNAAEASPAGGEIELRTELVAGSARSPATVRLVVRDRGVGMDEATQSRIFDPYFTTKSSGRSSGLGLSTVHAIVNQLEGNISVVSSPGVGSTFTVELPLHAAHSL